MAITSTGPQFKARTSGVFIAARRPFDSEARLRLALDAAGMGTFLKISIATAASPMRARSTCSASPGRARRWPRCATPSSTRTTASAASGDRRASTRRGQWLRGRSRRTARRLAAGMLVSDARVDHDELGGGRPRNPLVSDGRDRRSTGPAARAARAASSRTRARRLTTRRRRRESSTRSTRRSPRPRCRSRAGRPPSRPGRSRSSPCPAARRRGRR